MRPILLILTLTTAATLTGGEPFALVELFTSEGCSSCPPAEAWLNQLAADSKQKDKRVFPLAFHVDYWDYLGWRDPFAKKAFSKRQREYADKLKPNQAYTPQMFVNGSSGFVGSDRDTGRLHIARALKQAAPTQINITEHRADPNTLSLTWSTQNAPKGSILQIAITASSPARRVGRGENRGRKLAHANVVHLFRSYPLSEAADHGRLELKLPADLPKQDRWVVAYVQDEDTLQIHGAERIGF